MNVTLTDKHTVQVDFEGMTYNCSSFIDNDGFRYLTHYYGYCAETSDLIIDLNSDDLEEELRRKVGLLNATK